MIFLSNDWIAAVLFSLTSKSATFFLSSSKCFGVYSSASFSYIDDLSAKQHEEKQRRKQDCEFSDLGCIPRGIQLIFISRGGGVILDESISTVGFSQHVNLLFLISNLMKGLGKGKVIVLERQEKYTAKFTIRLCLRDYIYSFFLKENI